MQRDRAYTNPPPMVSQSQPADRPLPHRATTASVTSRSTTTRRHRTSRSHTGGYSYRPQNEFPNFLQTGDVEISVNADGQERRYMLHRLILAQNSGFFEAGTSEDWSRAQARGQSSGSGGSNGLGRIGEDDESGREQGRPTFPGPQGQRFIWRYELDRGTSEDEVPMLVQKHTQDSLFGGDYNQPPPVPNKPPPPASGFLRSMSNFSAMQSASHIAKANPSHAQDSDTIRDYDNMFRIFYNYPPSLDAVNIAESYIQCKSLLTLADMYDALEVVGPRIDHHLLQFQGRLWKQIAKYPPSYLKLGYLARSKVVFAEAMVHVVGQWPSGSSQLRHTVPESVLEVIEDKVDELAELKMKTEARLFRLSLSTSRGERVTPTNSYLDWLALSLFRQWLAENTTPPPPPAQKPPDSSRHTRPPPPQPQPISSGHLFRLLGAGGSSYLGRDELKRFVKLRPDEHSRETLKKFEKCMDQIKALAREVVRPLMKSYLELDLGRDGGGLGYLTCTKVEEGDFPFD